MTAGDRDEIAVIVLGMNGSENIGWRNGDRQAYGFLFMCERVLTRDWIIGTPVSEQAMAVCPTLLTLDMRDTYKIRSGAYLVGEVESFQFWSVISTMLRRGPFTTMRWRRLSQSEKPTGCLPSQPLRAPTPTPSLTASHRSQQPAVLSRDRTLCRGVPIAFCAYHRCRPIVVDCNRNGKQ